MIKATQKRELHLHKLLHVEVVLTEKFVYIHLDFLQLIWAACFDLIFWLCFFSETSLVEIQKVLLLMLGCAVQSDNKEQFVNVIKHLHLDVQAAIVDHIKQVN